jgi:hypothetical protein
MSTSSCQPSRPSSFSWGVTLAASSLLLIGGGVVIWKNRASDQATSELLGPISDARPSRQIPLPPPAYPVAVELGIAEGIHAVEHAVENGTRVVKIKVVADGDQLIIDANTGRLLETRPNRPSAPPPMGKFAAPFAPIM